MKSLFILFSFISSWGTLQSNDNGLPQKAQDFIVTHFPTTEVLRVKEAKDGSFEVMLKTGHELDFDKDGEWLEVDGDYLPLPKSVIDLLPVEVQKYLAQKYSRKAIVKIEKEVSSYEVELSNSVELIFDRTGKFIKKD